MPSFRLQSNDLKCVLLAAGLEAYAANVVSRAKCKRCPFFVVVVAASIRRRPAKRSGRRDRHRAGRKRQHADVRQPVLSRPRVHRHGARRNRAAGALGLTRRLHPGHFWMVEIGRLDQSALLCSCRRRMRTRVPTAGSAIGLRQGIGASFCLATGKCAMRKGDVFKEMLLP